MLQILKPYVFVMNFFLQISLMLNIRNFAKLYLRRKQISGYSKQKMMMKKIDYLVVYTN